MPFVIGTAGHIDHGKTSLVKALTGEDTDRLKEEKERGISIDLGFARLDLPDGTTAGVVDVPGHERFIRNMLAGAHGVDLVLVTVAADDGVMPQTEEHVDILHLLGVQRAIFVITKADLASARRIHDVEDEIRACASGTAFEHAPAVPFSFVTGRGLEHLRAEIATALRRCDKGRPSGYFRLPVDRVFSMHGHGLIVTGTARNGEIRVGDRVRGLPGNLEFRVRGIQVHNAPVETATWGQRVALNLSGPERSSLERGHVICDERVARVTDRVDAWLEVRPAAVKGIRNRQRVRVHLGTAERMGTLIVLGPRETIEPKSSAYCQIAVGEPFVALRGDHFVIRDETAQRTLGGGIVIHPWARKHKKAEPGLPGALQALHRGELAQVIGTFLDDCAEFAVSPATLGQFLNLRDDELHGDLDSLGTIHAFSVEGERLYAAEARWHVLQGQLLGTLRDFHRAHALAAGMDMEVVRDAQSEGLAPRLFRAIVEQLEAESALVREGSVLRLAGHRIQLRDQEREVMERITALLGRTPCSPPDLRQIEQETGIDGGRLIEVIRLMEREKSVVRVAGNLYYLGASIDRIRSTLCTHLSMDGDVTLARFRDLFGTTRKYAIPLLEYFDREGTTVRVGEARRLKTPPSTARL